jgi:hypothetical protein
MKATKPKQPRRRKHPLALVTAIHAEGCYWPAQQSLAAYYYSVYAVRGMGFPYTDWLFKLRHLAEWLDHDGRHFEVTCFIDGTDVLPQAPEQLALRCFKESKQDILFGADMNCWPHPAAAPLFPLSPSALRFLNSGCFIGKTTVIRDALHHALDNYACVFNDDQCIWSQVFLSKLYKIGLDYEQQLVTNRYANHTRLEYSKGFNAFALEGTGTVPAFIHGNGGVPLHIYLDKLCPDVPCPMPLKFAPHFRAGANGFARGNQTALCPSCRDTPCWFTK